MCGIVGHVGLRSTPQEITDLLLRQLKSISYRGPDSQDTKVQEDVAFGHTRLSIIDLSAGGQPMASTDGRYLITYNGEVYNYIELRAELEALGVRFQTSSDTEVVLAAYAQWNERALEKLNGMFAFAIYDFREKSLFCARDPYGQKPFFYSVRNGRFHFGSEVRVFKSIPGFSNEVGLDSIAQFLSAESFYSDRSIYKNVHKLPPGHFLRWKDETLTLKRYFLSIPLPDTAKLSVNDAVERVDHALQEATRLSIRADVPVGLLLSGGLDSSLVLAYFRKCHPSGKVSAFHVQMDDPTYDESAYAKEAANALKVDLTIFKLGLKELADLARRIPTLLDEPQADPGILPKYFVCREIAKSFKVALTGDGSDELFYGYLILKAQAIARYYRHVPSALHSGIIEPLVRRLPSGAGYMRKDFLAKQFMRGFPAPDALRASRWMRSFSDGDLRALLVDNAAAENASAQNGGFLSSVWAEAAGSGHLGKFAYQLQRTYLPDYVLCNSDRASMLSSLELRCPLLDPNLARLANSLADSLKMPGLSTKHLLKKVAEKHLPHSVIYRKKIGFTVPMADLLRTTLRGDLFEAFDPKVLARQGLFRSEPIQQLIQRHLSGKENLYKPLWTLYSLQKWLVTEGVS